MSCQSCISSHFTETRNSIFDATTNRQAMIDEFDLDQDGEISEQEFIAFVFSFPLFFHSLIVVFRIMADDV